jgi:hypothetical protein
MPEQEFEKLEKENSRDARRKRRQTQRSRRAIALPDREPLRTHRSPIGRIQEATIALQQGYILKGMQRITLDSDSYTYFERILQENQDKQEALCQLSQGYKQEKLVWRCIRCHKPSSEIKLIRRGLDGKPNLCFDCGLVVLRQGSMEPVVQYSTEKLYIPSWHNTNHSSTKLPSVEQKSNPITTEDGSPLWLVNAIQSLQDKYPQDHFEIAKRLTRMNTYEYKIACFDCPGKEVFFTFFENKNL